MAKDDLSGLLKGIGKKLKGVEISPLSEVRVPYKTRRRTGIYSLDFGGLKGGFPAGAVSQVFGPPNVGKTMLAHRTIACVQEDYGDKANILWMSFGYAPDEGFMRMNGVDPEVGNLVILSRNREADEAPTEMLLEASAQMIKSGKFQLVVIDEIGSGETRHNVVKGLHEDSKVASFATLMSNWCKRVYEGLRTPLENGDPNETCILVLTPVRANMDTHSAKFNPWTIPGGHALKHAKAVDVHIKPAGKIRKGKIVIGKTVGWKIAKGKLGVAEGATGSFDFIHNEGVDGIADLANTAKAYGAIKNKGAFYYILDYEDRISGGLDGVVGALRKNPDAVRELREWLSSMESREET